MEESRERVTHKGDREGEGDKGARGGERFEEHRGTPASKASKGAHPAALILRVRSRLGPRHPRFQ